MGVDADGHTPFFLTLENLQDKIMYVKGALDAASTIRGVLYDDLGAEIHSFRHALEELEAELEEEQASEL